jgi:hypothetical protein
VSTDSHLTPVFNRFEFISENDLELNDSENDLELNDSENDSENDLELNDSEWTTLELHFPPSYTIN